MMKKYLLTTILISALIVGCNSDVFVEETNSIDKVEATARTIKLSTTMPGDNNTRVALEEGNNGISLAWKDGDKIYLIFDDGENKGKQTIVLNEAEEHITNGGKTAKFDIVVPDGINNDFTLYGVHGGGGFVNETSYELKLPTASETIGASLEELSGNNALMTQFKVEVETVNSEIPDISVKFEHIGSLFKVIVTNNTGYTTSGHLAVSLVADSDSPISVYQPNEGATYNPTNETFTGLVTKNNLPFNNGNDNIEIVNTAEFWGWYIPIENASCPEFRLNVRSTKDPNVTLTTSNSIPVREAGFSIGKGYRFYVSQSWGSEDTPVVNFTNNTGDIFPEPESANYFTDPRDFNIYKYVTIGDQTWMAENLRYIPDDAVLGECYLINGYNGNNIEDAIATDGYKTYGLYYNWTTAVAGETSTDEVQDVCPDGWKLPESSEFYNLFLGEDAAAFKAAGTHHWDTDNGDNSNGFNAYGGGYYFNEVSQDFKEKAIWWSSISESAGYANVHIITDKGGVDNAPETTQYAYDTVGSYVNVRCIRDTSSGGGVDH